MMALARFFFQWIVKYPDTKVGEVANPVGDPEATLFGLAATVGLVFLGFRIFDGVTDPVAGAVSDAWVKKGRERRGLLWFSFIWPPIGLAMIFAPDGAMPSSLRWTLLAGGMFVFFVGYTFYAIPYWSLIDDYSGGDTDRRRVLSNVLGAALLGATLIGFVVSGVLIEHFGYRAAAMMFSGPAMVLMILPYFAKPPGLPPLKPEPSAGGPGGLQNFLRAFKHRRFVGVLLIFAGSQMSLSVMTGAAPVIVERLLDGTESDVGLVLGPFLVVALPCFAFVPWLSRKLGWEKAIAYASLGLGAVYVGTAFLGEALIVSKMVTAVCLFALGGPMVAVLLGLEGEAVTECAREAGGEVTSVYFGVFNFFIKGMNGVAVFLTSLLNDASKGDWGDWAVRAMGVMAGCMLAVGVALYYLARPRASSTPLGGEGAEGGASEVAFGDAPTEVASADSEPQAMNPAAAQAAALDALSAGDGPTSMRDLPPVEGDGEGGLMDTVAEDD
jgi:Na+/melibiose symporter-like transporter